MNKELVSAVISTHKRQTDIVERALKSVLAQSYKPIEVIVVDDSPEDYEHRQNVRTMVESYQGVRYIAHEKCQGACVARNTGLMAAAGKFIAFLDDDDEWKSNKIEEQIKGFTDDDIALVYCDAERFNELTGETRPFGIDFHNGYVYEALVCRNFIGSTSFPLIRTEAIKALDGFDPLMQSAQDYDMWLRLSQKYKVNYVDKPLVKYYVHEFGQISKSPMRKIAGLERLNEKNMDYLKKNRTAYSRRLLALIPFYAQNSEIRKALIFWLKAAVRCPLNIKKNVICFCVIFKNMFIYVKK